MATYQFPIMTIEEATEFFNTDGQLRQITGSVMKEADFKQPDPQKWRQIYAGLYELLTSVPFEMVYQQHRMKMCDVTEYPDLYEEGIHLCLFALCMGRVLGACGISDFIVKDVVKPTTKRLLKIVSALLNFYKFQSGRLEVFNTIKDDMERQNEHYHQLVKCNDELRQKINNIKASQAEKEPQILQLQDDIREMNAKMTENYKVKTEMLKTIAETKAKLAENKALNDQVRLQILEAKKAGEKLSRQIVQSPERLKEEKKRMHEQIARLNAVKEERRQRILELRQQADRLKELEEEAEQAQKMIRAIKADDDKEKECAAEIAKIQDKIQNNEDTLQSLITKEQELDRMIVLKQEQISKLSLLHQHKMAGAKETLEQVTKELELQKEQYSEEQDQKKALDQQKAAIIDALQKRIDAHENTMEQMKGAYAMSLEKLEGYHTKLATTWENAREKIN